MTPSSQITLPADPAPPADGPAAVRQALDALAGGRAIPRVTRAGLVRAFGRHVLVRALFDIDRGTLVLHRCDDTLFLCAPTTDALEDLEAVIAPAFREAASDFGAAPLCLVHRPAEQGLRLAATPTIGVGLVRFSIGPFESPASLRSAARHEICHLHCWSGRRFLDEGMADHYAEDVPGADPGDSEGPSTRSLIEIDNGPDLHFERQAGDSVSAVRLRRRGVALAAALAVRHGLRGVRDLYEQIAGLEGPDAADAVAAALGCELGTWDATFRRPGDLVGQIEAAFRDLESGEAVPDRWQLNTLDALLRDLRRARLETDRWAEFATRRSELGVPAGAPLGLRATALQRRERVAARQAWAAGGGRVTGLDPVDRPLEGLGLVLGPVRVARSGTFSVEVDRLTIGAGQRIALVGPNGSGKSTLLGLLAGDVPDALQIDGEPAGRWLSRPAHRARIGAAIAETPYHPAARVSEMLDLHRALFPRPAEGVLELFDFAPHVRTELRALSRGWRQALSLHFALAHRPALVLLDEPSTSLDADLRTKLHDYLRGCADDRRQTLVYATHSSVELDLADRIIVIQGGRIRQDATRDSLLGRLGPSRVTIPGDDAWSFELEFRTLPGFRNHRHLADRLVMYGDAVFAGLCRATAESLGVVGCSIEAADSRDLLQMIMEPE